MIFRVSRQFRILPCFAICWCTLLLPGFCQTSGEKAIESLKHLPVSKLDSSLPDVSFLAWFGRMAGQNANIRWEENDCGEQKVGAPSDKEDAPICVAAYADRADGRKVSVLVRVGTNKKGVNSAPAVFEASLEADGKTQKAKRLHNLEDMLKK